MLVLAVLSAQAAGIPMTLVSDDEADPIHSAIKRKELWTQDPVRRLRAAADKSMKEGPWSVLCGCSDRWLSPIPSRASGGGNCWGRGEG